VLFLHKYGALVILLEDFYVLRNLLKENIEISETFEELLVAAKLIGYMVSVKKMEHKTNLYFAMSFSKNKKEVHLDFSFKKNGQLISVCTCRADCKSLSFNSEKDKFIKTIDCFREIL
jgi:hypothetical protein